MAKCRNCHHVSTPNRGTRPAYVRISLAHHDGPTEKTSQYQHSNGRVHQNSLIDSIASLHLLAFSGDACQKKSKARVQSGLFSCNKSLQCLNGLDTAWYTRKRNRWKSQYQGVTKLTVQILFIFMRGQAPIVHQTQRVDHSMGRGKMFVGRLDLDITSQCLEEDPTEGQAN